MGALEPARVALRIAFEYCVSMEFQDAGGPLPLLLNLLIYPIALSPIVLWLFLGRERRASRAFRDIMALLLSSTVAAAAVSLQLFFSHIDLLLPLRAVVGDILYQILSVLVLTGFCLYISRLPAAQRSVNGREGKPLLSERILASVVRAASGASSILLFLALIPASDVPEMLLSVALTTTFASFALSYLHTVVVIVVERKRSPRFVPLMVLLCGDPVFLLLPAVFPGLNGQTLISVLFVYHFTCLFFLLRLSRPETGRRALTDEERMERLLSAGLSKRESEVALSRAKGLSYKRISDIHCISLSTVQTHTSRIYGKLGVNNKTELAAKIEER